MRDYVRTGKVRLQARTLHFIGPDSARAARVAAGARAAGQAVAVPRGASTPHQGTENSGYVTDAFLRRVAAAAGVDAGPALAQADAAFATGRLARADADADAARRQLDADARRVAQAAARRTCSAADALDPQSVARALNAELAR